MSNFLYMIVAIASGGIAFISLIALVLVVFRFPSIVVLLTSKHVVWEISGTGHMVAAKATAIGGALRTKRGVYFYEKLDVINFHNIPGILVNMASDAKAIRPDIQPVLSLMKKLNISNREKLYALLDAPLITKKAYNQLLKNQQKAPVVVEEEPEEYIEEDDTQ